MSTRLDGLPDNYLSPSGDWVAALRDTFTLDPRHTALVIIDMQYYSASRDAGFGAKIKEWGREEIGRYRFERIENILVPNLQRLSSFLRQHGMKVVYTTQGSTMPDYSDLHPHLRRLYSTFNGRPGTREMQILEELQPLPGDAVVHKTTPGAFNSSNLDAILQGMGVRDLLIGGVTSNGCVESTTRDAADRGYRCVLVDDCTGGDNEEYHRMTVLNIQRIFGRVATTDQVIAELSERL